VIFDREHVVGFFGTVCRRRPALLAALATVAACLAVPSVAGASEKITANAAKLQLRVDGKGRAVVSWTKGGVRRHAAVWGAINARHPDPTRPQVRFRIDYSGGWQKLGFPLYKTINNRCGRYDGPWIPWLVKACKAPDGSYWALQRFKRLMPNLGMDPWLPRHRTREVHLSHWKGPIAKLEVYANWVQSQRWHELFGRLTYKGVGVYGFKTLGYGEPGDAYGRLIYLDTYNSALGRGWKRENSFLARRKATPGHFCYHFVPRERYSWYPPGPIRPAAHGEKYRLTGGGPGVTPYVMTRVKGLDDFDGDNPTHLQIESEMNPLKTVVVGPDDGCMGN
jgi:hypothetical protein